MPQEYTARWQGARVGAGASVFHFESIAGPTAAAGLATAVRTLMQSLAGTLPNDVQISFDTEVRELANDGTLIDVYPVTPPASVTGAGTTAFANGTGILVRHSTGVILNGRRILGRTFLVPVTGNSFADNGDVLGATQTTVNNAFATFITNSATAGANFAVWSRANAAVAPVVSSSAVSRPTTLRTRNDRV